jgi:hypothetical protein
MSGCIAKELCLNADKHLGAADARQMESWVS